MAITALESNTVSRGAALAKRVLELKAEIDYLNIIYDASGGVKETLTQAELDSVPSFSGVTKAQVDDGMFALTSGLKTAITNSYTQLAQLAART